MVTASYLPRLVDARLLAALNSFSIVIIDGPRGAGKTTTAERVAKSKIRLPQDLPLLAVDPGSTLAALEGPVLIDEWQLAGTDFLWELKRIVDLDPQPGRLILTGSVEPASYGPTYPLTGRAVRLLMQPMTAAERRGEGHEPTFLDHLAGGGFPPPGVGAPSFTVEQLFTTGFPAARDQHDPSMFLDGYAALVSQRAGDEGRDSSRLLKTMAVLGVLTAQALPDQRIWESADINKASWKAYEDLLARTHVSAPIPAYSSNRLKRLTSYPKRMLTDTALALALSKLTPDDLRQDPTAAGHFVESYVTQQIRAQADVAGALVSHLRTSGGAHEVDLVLELGAKRYGIEVKAGSRPTRDDAKHLRWLDSELADGLAGGFVMHTGGDTYPLGKNLWALPIGLL